MIIIYFYVHNMYHWKFFQKNLFFKIKKLSTHFDKKLLRACVMREIINIHVVITRSTHINLWSIITVIIRTNIFSNLWQQKRKQLRSLQRNLLKSLQRKHQRKRRDSLLYSLSFHEKPRSLQRGFSFKRLYFYARMAFYVNPWWIIWR